MKDLISKLFLKKNSFAFQGLKTFKTKKVVLILKDI